MDSFQGESLRAFFGARDRPKDPSKRLVLNDESYPVNERIPTRENTVNVNEVVLVDRDSNTAFQKSFSFQEVRTVLGELHPDLYGEMNLSNRS